MKLFDKQHVAGIFRGFSAGGLEFHADIILPYRNDFQSTPMHGQFVIVQLESETEAVLGRIVTISSDGRLASGPGEDFGIRAVAEERTIPEDLREQYLKYRVDIRVLGVIRVVDKKLVFAPSHRRMPHVGSKVAFLSDDLMQEIAGHNSESPEIGFLALGEFIYSGGDIRLAHEPWMVIKSPEVLPKFDVQQLVSRRSFVFARAGFGKSNLVKLLFSSLYKKGVPTVTKRGNKQVPVGTLIFDPDGEYYWPDDKGRPGLCDVPGLENQVVVFTKKAEPSPYYGSFVGGEIKLDVRRLRPSDVLSIALSPEKQDQQNIRKLKALSQSNWTDLVNLIHKYGNAAEDVLVASILSLNAQQQQAELWAAKANMTSMLRMLHDPGSQLLDMLLAALKEGKICIVDVSQMRGTPALILSGLILKKIFDHNQDEFTKANPETIPTIAVIEEAQSVLGNRDSSGEGPYVSWVKEGRKFDLGALLVTQQPGSIPDELLSQGDNWFIFHLLSAGDLKSVKNANAHFSDDLLSSLLNEPIPGHGVYWSSVGGKPYPVPIRALLFESMYQPHDPDYDKPAISNYATELKKKFANIIKQAKQVASTQALSGNGETEGLEGEMLDIDQVYLNIAAESLKNHDIVAKLKGKGMPYKGLMIEVVKSLPETINDSDKEAMAFKDLRRILTIAFGEGKWRIEMRDRVSGTGSQVKWVLLT